MDRRFTRDNKDLPIKRIYFCIFLNNTHGSLCKLSDAAHMYFKYYLLKLINIFVSHFVLFSQDFIFKEKRKKRDQGFFYVLNYHRGEND